VQLFLTLAAQVLAARDAQKQGDREPSGAQRKFSAMRIRPNTQLSHNKKSCC